MSESRLFGSVVEHWIIDPAARVRFPPKSWDFFQPNLLCFVVCYGFHVVRWGLSPGLDLLLRQNGLILRRNGFHNYYLEEGECCGRWLCLRHGLWIYTQSLTTASGSRLFGSVVAHWIIDQAARVRFPPKSWDFFQPNLLCFVVCYGFHVVRVCRGALSRINMIFSAHLPSIPCASFVEIFNWGSVSCSSSARASMSSANRRFLIFLRLC